MRILFWNLAGYPRGIYGKFRDSIRITEISSFSVFCVLVCLSCSEWIWRSQASFSCNLRNHRAMSVFTQPWRPSPYSLYTPQHFHRFFHHRCRLLRQACSPFQRRRRRTGHFFLVQEERRNFLFVASLFLLLLLLILLILT